MTKPIYVLGTGLSHDGSAVLLKDGRVCVGIEKERITRLKHDGGNDSAAIEYCLAAEGIALGDVALVVQCANFEVPARDRYAGQRVFEGNDRPPLVSISHHLAHAWSAAGTMPFDDAAIMVIDGCGSPIDQCTDLDGGIVWPAAQDRTPAMWCEKDSFYRFDGARMTPLLKDFSAVRTGDSRELRLPTTEHSIGGFYEAVSRYVFGDLNDVGKLMGLAPYGRAGAIVGNALVLRDERVFVETAWRARLDRPAADYAAFRADFQYYADVAWWAQREVEKAVAALFRARMARFPVDRIAYAGGVALNAVANARLLDEAAVRDLYTVPAAGDNGLALGCAFHGWVEVLGQLRIPHDGSSCFGRRYASEEIDEALAGGAWDAPALPEAALLARVAALLAAGKTVGWFQGGSEFGPRALGRRSILAHPGWPGLGDRINADIKRREDFRPFAPAVLPDHASALFQSGRDSPYMILIDRTLPEHRAALANVTHVDGTSRVQTIDAAWNPRFHRLVEAFHALTGIPALLNTSFNRRGMPMVERPAEALALFEDSAMHALVLEDRLLIKPDAFPLPIPPARH